MTRVPRSRCFPCFPSLAGCLAAGVLLLFWATGGIATGARLNLRMGAVPVLQPGGIHLNWDAPGSGWRFTVEYRDGWETSGEDEGTAGGWRPLPGQWPTEQRSVVLQWADLGIPAHGTVAGPWLFRVRAEPPPVERGTVIRVEPVIELGQGLLRLILLQAGADLEPMHDVILYRVIYQTVDPFGLPTQASGAVALPLGVSGSLPLASYQHGTVLEREDVPSRFNGEGLLPVGFASKGYVGVAADYLGLGDSPGPHPYLHAASTATSVIDLIRATRLVCADRGIPLNGQVFLCGYSQGGHATLAAQREMEMQHPDEFEIAASSAMAGPYDLEGVAWEDSLSGRRPPNPYYQAYLLSAYTGLYGLADNVAHLLVEPYATTVPPLLDGTRGASAVNAAMPPVPRDAMDPAWLASVQEDPSHPFRRALRENSLTRWTPQAPTWLLHCSGDLDVLPLHSQVAYERFIEQGAMAVEWMDPMPGADHGGCVLPSFLRTLEWFDQQVRQGE